MSDIKCSNENCNVSEDGKCAEGHQPKDCPKAIRTIKETIKKTPKKLPFELIYNGEALDIENAHVVTANKITRIVLLVGPPDCGKSTLMCCLNQQFQKAPFADYLFKGSLTLIGFEKITHDSRTSSGRNEEDTPRTPLDPLERFFHLSLSKQDESETYDVLFADVSGEHYKYLKNSKEYCKQFSLLKRADHIVFILDGEKLMDLKSRHGIEADALTLLQTCIDSEMLGLESHVEILISKWDMITAKKDSNVLEFIEKLKFVLNSRFLRKFASFKFYNICSRIHFISDIKPGYGINELLPTWLNESPFFKRKPSNKNISDNSREFLKFGSNG